MLLGQPAALYAGAPAVNPKNVVRGRSTCESAALSWVAYIFKFFLGIVRHTHRGDTLLARYPRVTRPAIPGVFGSDSDSVTGGPRPGTRVVDERVCM